MLDDATKKRINSLRQILVGKLPDPKAQVEQITNGLIYKFMNDMDEQSVSMGGKSTYFSGKFQKYSWKNLLDTKTSGVEKIALYSEAIEQMYTNENLPELFREIFKNSFLPFKDPSTLNMFLKEINEFHYSNSEKLGDAFEYLLSFMGSQGDAGQFRTPRHIIDFITEIVNPQKNETVLDPACGTAGFLISSYKHILKQNTKKNLGDSLSASDRKNIGENLNGYDISPDMVKMSLVNMYLHKFTNPKINEYDTLSSEDRWNEYYDVILANPPFFSPKGGIMPHNRFGVNSTKAEVLFIDYINEHLKPSGRAGIIVPEGIIFQNGIAYKQLRKSLINNSLLAVISLPAGVFQPYSGVKTSILILDKERNKSSDKVYFIKIENDGYSLTANRNEIKGGQLKNFSENFFNKIQEKNKNVKFLLKKDLLLHNNFSLTTSNYEDYSFESKKYPSFKLSDICIIKTGKKDVNEGNPNGIYPFYTCAEKNTYSDKYSFDCEALLIVGNGRWTGKVNYYKGKFEAYQRTYVLSNFKGINCKFLYYILINKMPQYLDKLKIGNAIPFIKLPMLQDFKFPLPDLEIQNQIVKELDGYQKIIDGCKQVIKNYKPFIDIDSNSEVIELGDLCKIYTGKLNANAAIENGKYPFFTCAKEIFKIDNYAYDCECLLLSGNNASGNYDVKYYKGKFNAYQRTYIIEIKESYLKRINYDILKSIIENQLSNLKNLSSGSLTKYLTLPVVKSIKTYLLSEDTIKEKTEILKKEIKTIENNKELIKSISNRIDSKINNIWST